MAKSDKIEQAIAEITEQIDRLVYTRGVLEALRESGSEAVQGSRPKRGRPRKKRDAEQTNGE